MEVEKRSSAEATPEELPSLAQDKVLGKPQIKTTRPRAQFILLFCPDTNLATSLAYGRYSASPCPN
jgi:hypothetical protein